LRFSLAATLLLLDPVGFDAARCPCAPYFRLYVTFFGGILPTIKTQRRCQRPGQNWVTNGRMIARESGRVLRFASSTYDPVEGAQP